ncbi:hypothetical protein EKL30_02400 [Candidimonas sp. SYP-B2681]|uniref:hypothetical protein n=1 Tax=Candidimonas sp. SYP-B2681 TaxID=2497686 RepID=UPI000F89374C|nr:hypothetical protein [Candidimonas sp. SYP-B2681]RTZ48277.1 hypothetical protein EKL30_02400 [Candidimonas sp. SYP-B2681]
MVIGLSACASPAWVQGSRSPHTEEMSADQLGQTDFNRTLTIAMRDNLDSLTRLLEKLYRRNPTEWHKTGAPDLASAVREGRKAILTGQAPSGLGSLRDVEIMSVAMDPAYQGDRVGAFVFGMADMIIRAHNGKIRFYATDVVNAQHVYNSARNVEVASWLLATRRNAAGHPLLLANEASSEIANLSFEREFGQLVGRLDLVANLLDENLRRVGINYMQGLLLFNFLPVR